MAVHKATRSNPPAQLQPQHAKNARIAIPDRAKAARSGSPGAGGPKPVRHTPDHQLKAEIFETLRHLNRGYGVALAAFDRLETKDRQHPRRAFPAGFLHDYRNRTEALRAQSNRDLLLLIAEREEQEAARFTRPSSNVRPKPRQ
jgi:hypothetical protein